MEEKIKGMVVIGFCLGVGLGDVFPGDIVELSPYQFRLECDELGRVNPMHAESAPSADDAREGLIKQINEAPDHESLELLLSEDPDIAAAYEKRLAELDEPVTQSDALDSTENGTQGELSSLGVALDSTEKGAE